MMDYFGSRGAVGAAQGPFGSQQTANASVVTPQTAVLSNGSVNVAGVPVAGWFVGIALTLAGIRVLTHMGAKVD